MSIPARFSLRLRRRMLRWYEMALCGLLLALAITAVLPPGSAGDGERAAPVQCGNIQSSTVVMQR